MNATILTIIAGFFGWLLNEWSHARRAGAAERALMGRAIADLLELRNYLQAFHFAIEEIQKRVSLTDAQIAQLEPFWRQFAPPDPELPLRYREAVSKLAEVRPILAYRLRRKHEAPGFVAQLRAQLETYSGPPELNDMMRFLDDEFRRALDDSIRELAFAHGLGTWIRARSTLSHRPTIPPEIVRFLDVAKRSDDDDDLQPMRSS